MRVASLEAGDVPTPSVKADICIIGAGAAGLYLAKRLGEAGHVVVVLEAGPKTCVSPQDAGFQAEFTGDVYQGAVDGRAFGVGGTTARWGGQLVPFCSADAVRHNIAHGDAWAHVVRSIGKYGDAVSRVLGLRHEDDTALGTKLDASTRSAIAEAGLAAHTSRWLPFSRRNFQWMIPQARVYRNGVTIICDAVAVGWRLQSGEGGLCRISDVEAASASGKRLLVGADCFIIAAGGIESPRILQEIDSTGGGVIPQSAAVGRYLSDHISFKVGEVNNRHRGLSIDAFGPFFERGQMRTWRFIESSPDPAAPRFFAHFLFALDNPGFNFARTILQDIQAGRMPTFRARDLWAGGTGLAHLAWSRGVHSRLFIPAATRVSLQLDIEQRPEASNSVRLGQTLDRHGRRIAHIQWKISDRDRSDMGILQRNFLSAWARPMSGLPGVSPAGELDPMTKPHGAYHPVGTCRIGDDAEAVVDRDLKVRGTSNLHVLSTAVFPSAGTANPTFSLLCMAEMLVEKLVGFRV